MAVVFDKKHSCFFFYQTFWLVSRTIFKNLKISRIFTHMEPLLVEFQPVETSDMVFVNHEGEEFLYILEGTVEFRTDDRMEILEPGDSLYFNSDINHSLRSLKGKTAKAIGVIWNKV